MVALTLGDILIIRAQIYPCLHYGVYVNGKIATIGPQKGKLEFVAPEKFILQGFAGIRRCPEDQKARIAERIERIKLKKYSYLSWNCEHCANYIQTGVPKSRQLDFSVLTLIILGLY